MPIRKVILLIAILLVLSIYIVGRVFRQPDKQLVNGSYTNTCCSLVTMQDGQLAYGESHATYRLTWMKFGLTAFVPGDMTATGVTKSNSESTFIFEGPDGKRGFRTMVSGREYKFERIE